MRRPSYLPSFAAALLLAAIGVAQESNTGQSGGSAIRVSPSLKFEHQSAGRLISVEVILAETPVVGNGKDMSVEKIAELEKAGKLLSHSRYWVSLVENQPSDLQFGERLPLVLGRTNFGGGRASQEAVALENVGTKLSLLGRVDGDSVLVKMELEQSRLIPSPAKAEGDAAEAVFRPRLATTTYQSTLTIPPGKTTIAAGKETVGEQGRVQTWLLVSATAEGAKREAGDDGSQTKIFRLLNAKPEPLAKAMLGIFGKDTLQIGVDERTNSLIVRGNANTLEIIQRIIISLDQPNDEKK